MTPRRWALVAAVAVLAIVGIVAGFALAGAFDDEEEGTPETQAPATAPSAAVPIAPAGSVPRPAAPNAQAAAEAATMAAWTPEEVVAALQTPVQGEPVASPEDRSGPLPRRAQGTAEMKTVGNGRITISTSKAATRRCRQPSLLPAEATYPYTRSCYSGPLDRMPAKVVGQMVMDMPTAGGFYKSSCTATVAATGNSETAGNSSVIVTAGHCLGIPARGDEDATGQWQQIKNLFFVRAHNLQQWLNLPRRRRTMAELRKRAWFPLVDGQSHPIGFIHEYWRDWGQDYAYHWDFGAVVMRPRVFNGRAVPIAQRLGGLGITMGQGGGNRSVRSLGYPAVDHFRPYFRTLFQCTATATVGDRRAPNDPYRATLLGIGCDMSGGSSGGPWLADMNGDGSVEIMSVNSNGPPEVMFGPDLGADHWPVFDLARKT